MKAFSSAVVCVFALCAMALPSLAQTSAESILRATVLVRPLRGKKAVPAAAIEKTIGVLRKRINATGIAEPEIRSVGSDRIVIGVPITRGETQAQQRKWLSRIVQGGRLEFIWLRDVRTSSVTNAAANPRGRYVYEGGSRFRDSRSNKALTQAEVQSKVLYADPRNTIVSGADLKPSGAQVDIVNGSGVVTRLAFNNAGTRKFAEFTRTHIGSLLAIVVNGQIQSAPRITAEIKDGTAVIQGNTSTVKEAQDLANMLNAGPLPVGLKIVSVETVKAR
jgi:protein-export membrane protein SecD